MERHVSLLGALHVAYGVIGVCIGLFLFWLFAGGGLLSGDGTAMAFTSLFGLVLGGLIGIMSIPHLFVGYGLLKRRPWSRIVALIVGAASLIDIPFGTILGIYTLWVVLQEDSIRLLTPTAAA